MQTIMISYALIQHHLPFLTGLQVEAPRVLPAQIYYIL